jgi:[mycofactocin precursor peptide]-tyrosine decarboxylase / 3-amino-5-[(4-hydroxyphenyl)methyl]-4,4-dimethylpyrrolidin-2-one synthase
MTPLVIIPQYFGSLVFDRRTSRYAPFDHAATVLLERCLLESAWDRPEVDFIECFERAGYFHADGRLAGVKLDAEPPRDHLLGPLATHVEVIAACNLTCTHCFAGELPRKTTLTTRELDRVFGELAALGSFRLGLTGGEPLLRKDLLDVIDAALAHGLHPCLTTNGLLLDEHVARELGKRELVWLNVSLEGAQAATNDRIRGDGVFDAVVGKLRALGRYMRFTLAFTITSASAGEIEACAQLARELGAHTAVFRPLYPVGMAKLEMMPSFAEYTGALAKLTGDTNVIDPLGFSPRARIETQAITYRGPGCGAANLVASISASGDVNPCSFLGAGFDSGNVRDRPFAEIWNAGQAFLALRESSGEFRGGCRARALAAHGSAFARDPWHDEWLTGSASEDALPCAIEPLTNVHARVHLPVVS